MYFFTVLRLMPSFLAICRWVNPFLLQHQYVQNGLLFFNAPPRLR